MTKDSTQNNLNDQLSSYRERNEPPRYWSHSYYRRDKLVFLPANEVARFESLCANLREEAVLHYFDVPNFEERLTKNIYADNDLQCRFKIVITPDFTNAAMINNDRLYNDGILKTRVYASICDPSYWKRLRRNEDDYEPEVIIQIVWGKENSFDLAFNEISRGEKIAINADRELPDGLFEKGLCEAIKRIHPQKIFWYGNYEKHKELVEKIYWPELVEKVPYRQELLNWEERLEWNRERRRQENVRDKRRKS